MIDIQEEKLVTCLDELKVLFPLHYEELALNKDKVPLDPRYDQYQALEDAGKLFITTIREEEKLIGYFVGFIDYHLHYATCLTLTMDIFYIKQDRRAKLLGPKLMSFVERAARIKGVHRMFVGSKLHKSADVLFKYQEFTPVETYHSKWLGEQ